MTPVGKVIFRISPLVILWLLRNNWNINFVDALTILDSVAKLPVN
jgi:hypothetical protein